MQSQSPRGACHPGDPSRVDPPKSRRRVRGPGIRRGHASGLRPGLLGRLDRCGRFDAQCRCVGLTSLESLEIDGIQPHQFGVGSQHDLGGQRLLALSQFQHAGRESGKLVRGGGRLDAVPDRRRTGDDFQHAAGASRSTTVAERHGVTAWPEHLDPPNSLLARFFPAVDGIPQTYEQRWPGLPNRHACQWISWSCLAISPAVPAVSQRGIMWLGRGMEPGGEAPGDPRRVGLMNRNSSSLAPVPSNP
jgi:hypothetical protein